MINSEKRKLIREAKSQIPSVDKILIETLERLNLSPNQIRKNFSQCIVSVDETATGVYKNYERVALFRLAEEWLEMQEYKIKSKLAPLLSVGKVQKGGK